MPELTRFGVSMDPELLTAFDALVKRQGYGHRSEALRDLARDALVQSGNLELPLPESLVILCVLYDPTEGSAVETSLARLRQTHRRSVVSAMQVRDSSCRCLEVLVLRHRVDALEQDLAKLRDLKGVLRTQLVPMGERICDHPLP